MKCIERPFKFIWDVVASYIILYNKYILSAKMFDWEWIKIVEEYLKGKVIGEN